MAEDISYQTPCTYLAVVAGEVEVMQGVVCRRVDEFLKVVTIDHVTIMDLVD